MSVFGPASKPRSSWTLPADAGFGKAIHCKGCDVRAAYHELRDAVAVERIGSTWRSSALAGRGHPVSPWTQHAAIDEMHADSRVALSALWNSVLAHSMASNGRTETDDSEKDRRAR